MRDRLRHLFVETDGGSNRRDIIQSLDDRPANTNEIAEQLNLNYNTVRYHLEVLREHGIVESDGESYGEVYFLTEQFDLHYEVFERLVEPPE